jgi:hypothetical protein
MANFPSLAQGQRLGLAALRKCYASESHRSSRELHIISPTQYDIELDVTYIEKGVVHAPEVSDVEIWSTSHFI